MPSGITIKMATKNCPKCDSANPVACKKCACGHVFFTTRRSANAVATDYSEEISEPTTPQEPEIPRRRTARVTRERPKFYDSLQVENQTRRQRELQKRRKASKSDDVEVSSEEIPEKAAFVPANKKRAESPPAKPVEPPAKKRRGRPPGLTNRRSARAQILPTQNKSNDASAKAAEFADGIDGQLEGSGNIHDVPAVKALQMNLVLSDINYRISSSSVRAENLPPAAAPVKKEEAKEEGGKKENPATTVNATTGTKEEDTKTEAEKCCTEAKGSKATINVPKNEVPAAEKEPTKVKEKVTDGNEKLASEVKEKSSTGEGTSVKQEPNDETVSSANEENIEKAVCIVKKEEEKRVSDSHGEGVNGENISPAADSGMEAKMEAPDPEPECANKGFASGSDAETEVMDVSS